MKISVSSYSFQRLLSSGELDQVSVIEKAKEIGFDAVEFAGLTPHNGDDEREYAKKLNEEAKKRDFIISSYVFGADFLSEDLNAEIKAAKEQVDVAEILGVKIIRHDVSYARPPFPSFELVLPKIAGACREIADYAAQKGITTTVENHGLFFQDSVRMERLYSEVNHPNFGLLVDMGNFLCADEDPVAAVSRLSSLARLVHVKDFHMKSGSGPRPGEGFFETRGGNYLRGAIAGHGNVPVKQCLTIMDRAGYDGCVVLEYEGIEDVYTGVRIGLQNLKEYLKR